MFPWLIGGALAAAVAAIASSSSSDDDSSGSYTDYSEREEARRRERERRNEGIREEIREYVDKELSSIAKSIRKLEKRYDTKLEWEWYTTEGESLEGESFNKLPLFDIAGANSNSMIHALHALIEKSNGGTLGLTAAGALISGTRGSRSIKPRLKEEFLKAGERSKGSLEDESIDINKFFPRFVGLDTTLLKLEEVYLGKEIAKLKELQNAIK